MQKIYKSDQFSENGFYLHEELRFKDTVLSSIYLGDNRSTALIIDHTEIFNNQFRYKSYCSQQNHLMNHYRKVYRFIDGDSNIQKVLKSEAMDGHDYYGGRSYNREQYIPDPSPLEYLFESCFEEAYGPKAFEYLKREYSFITMEGKTAYVDYALFRKDGSWIAIEENGISYHHPALIKKNAYIKILVKQNTIVEQDGKVFRWDTESLQARQHVIDELKDFIGCLDDYLVQTTVIERRSFALHDHQTDFLKELNMDRVTGKKTALVVLPTGTGKTILALEDIKHFCANREKCCNLVLVPTRDLVKQWEKVLNPYSKQIGKIDVLTYAAASQRYFNEEPKKYKYIIIDEAHHSVAPVLRKVINHYQPDFMLGLTATDKRLDAQKLEDIFSHYEEKLDLKEAINIGILCQIRAYRLKTNIDLSEVRFNGKDYINAHLERSIRVISRNELIANFLYEYFYQKLPRKSGIVYCVSVSHAKEMADLLKKKGLSAESVDGSDVHRFKKVQKYMDNKLQFICTCSLLSEGWDAPHTSVIVMARPTLSKVLYMQQLGRGTRNSPGKEALYVIDVVDCYGSFGSITNRPWSIHSLFNIEYYKAFADLFPNRRNDEKELTLLDTTHEEVVKLEPYDLFTMQKSYENHLSPEQLARELFVSTGTVNSWYKKGDIKADAVIPMGRNQILFFHKDRIKEIRIKKGLKEHSDETIIEDFWNFIEQGTYTFSYKIFFLLSFLKTVNETGDADIRNIMEKYRQYYLERLESGKAADRTNCPYNEKDYLLDDRKIIDSILKNPFEKFERKRFMSYAKDLSKISLHVQ